MANEPVIATVTPAVTPQVPPVAVAPEPAPVAPVTTSPLTAETPPTASVEAPAAVPEAVVAPAAPDKASSDATPTILAEALDKAPAPVADATKPEFPKPAETKPPEAEVKPVEGDTKVPEGQSAEPAPPPTYEPFVAPEGVTLDAERLTKFTELLSELEVTGKADHAAMQQFGQKAVDFHVQEIKNAVESVTKLYQETWDRQKTEWKDTFLKDPEIGGNRFQTTVDAARTFIRTHGGTPEQQTEFRNVMESSGLGNHPAIIRLLANAGRAFEEGKPLAAVKPVSPPKSKTATLYGS